MKEKALQVEKKEKEGEIFIWKRLNWKLILIYSWKFYEVFEVIKQKIMSLVIC